MVLSMRTISSGEIASLQKPEKSTTSEISTSQSDQYSDVTRVGEVPDLLAVQLHNLVPRKVVPL